MGQFNTKHVEMSKDRTLATNQVISITQLPPEIITLILRNLNRRKRIRASTVCHLFNNIIRNNIGFNWIKLKEPSDCCLLEGSPLLKSTIIMCREAVLSDADMACLSGVHSISLQRSKITDEGVISLLAGGKSTIHRISLASTGVTDAALKALSGVHTIDICRCRNITVEGIKALKDVHDITLGNPKDSYLKQLGSVHTVTITNGPIITDDGIKSLTNVTCLAMTLCHKITDDGVKHLVNLERLTLYACDGITDTCFKYFPNLKYLYIRECINILDSGFQHLVNLEHLVLLNCSQITNNCLKHLKSLKRIELRGSNKITRKDVESLGIGSNK